MPAPAAPAPAPAACAPAPAPAACEAALAPAVWCRWTKANFLRTMNGPIGSSAASALLVWRSCPRNTLQRSQLRRWRRTSGLGRRRSPSAISPELDPDLVTGEQPRLGRLGQGHARSHEQRLDAGHGGLHRLGDLLVGHRVHLAQDQSGLLALGQLVDVADEQAELLALVRLVRGGRTVLGEVGVHLVGGDRARPAQMVEAAVAGDPVQPRPHVDRTLIGQDRVKGGGHHLLHDVLGVLTRAEQVAAEGQQPGLVAAEQNLKGALVPLADVGDQPLVGLQAQQRRPAVQPESTRIFQR